MIFYLTTINTQGESSQTSNPAAAVLVFSSTVASTQSSTQTTNFLELDKTSNQTSPQALLVIIVVLAILAFALVIGLTIWFCVFRKKYQPVSQVEMQEVIRLQ